MDPNDDRFQDRDTQWVHDPDRLADPREFPDARQRIVDMWKSTTMLETVRVTQQLSPQRADEYCAREARSVRDAELWWITGDMCDLMEDVRNEIPDDSHLDESVLPSLDGLAYFEHPQRGVDSVTGGPDVRVDAICWAVGKLGRAARPVVCFSSYRWIANQFFPLGRSDWLIGDEIGQITQLPAGDVVGVRHPYYHESALDDRRMAMTLWALTTQEKLAQVDDLKPSNPVRKRSERAGLSSRVRVVHLPGGGGGHHEGGGGTMTVRTIVRPHWRNQAYGPGRSLRRPTLIGAHWRGPEGAPVSRKSTVKVFHPPES